MAPERLIALLIPSSNVAGVFSVQLLRGSEGHEGVLSGHLSHDKQTCRESVLILFGKKAGSICLNTACTPHTAEAGFGPHTANKGLVCLFTCSCEFTKTLSFTQESGPNNASFVGPTTVRGATFALVRTLLNGEER